MPQEYFEQDHPGVTALFLMGCSADQNPYPRSELAYAQKHGRSLATAVEAALEVGQRDRLHPAPRAAVRCVRRWRTDACAGIFATPNIRPDFAYLRSTSSVSATTCGLVPEWQRESHPP